MDVTTVMAIAASALVMLAWFVLPGSVPAAQREAAVPEPVRSDERPQIAIPA
jgi:hypothetical protein